ncbi:cytochrome c peroxidase [Caenispirillum salinarum]|uniref:cytochrome c peroxidase n=1 Tax=Caenispirillum salinarum TaxID=859058 RepID=UPI00384D3211
MRLRFILGGAIWTAALAVAVFGGPARAASAELLEAFQRPETVPFPATNPYTPEKVALGERLFFDARLSGANDRSCASCHRPDAGFEDGLPTGEAIDGSPLGRRVPTIVNGAWQARFFWDGRAPGLEAQALGPIQNPREMNQDLTDLVAELRTDDELAAAFAEVFPGAEPALTAETIAKALAAYERTVVAGLAPFDRWAAGDADAVGDAAKRGFDLFTGKAGCVSCHSGWDFTDGAFHDIGLAGDDRGRGEILDMPEVDHAFKTPTLRDLPKRGPFMHDGSLPTLADVVDHYVDGTPKPAERPTLSPDLPDITLTPAERADLVAFLESLDADAPPPPFRAETLEPVTAALSVPVVSQRDKAFAPGAVKVAVGQPLRILNDDTRDHNVRVDDPRHTANSGFQEPGETVELAFPEPGTYHAFCGIHPRMELVVEVVDEP